MAEHPDLSALLEEFLSLGRTPETLPRRVELTAVLLPVLMPTLEYLWEEKKQEDAYREMAVLVAACAMTLAEWGQLQMDRRSLRQAIAGYNAVLSVMSHNAMPADWARMQMNRARACGHSPRKGFP